MEKEVAILSPRETQIAEMLAWGAAKKEVADALFISVRTVENTARNIYAKTGITKINELSAWWFCTNFKISFDLSPLKKKIVSILFLLVVIPHCFAADKHLIRSFKIRNNVRRAIANRRQEQDLTFEL